GADLSDPGEAALKALADAMKADPDASFRVEGRVGAPPANKREYPTPWHLGADRAIAVLGALVEAGAPAIRVTAGAVSDPGAPDALDLVWLPASASVQS